MKLMNLSNCLVVFNHILSNGELVEDKHYLGGLYAWHDFDGYTCYLGYKEVVMSLYFHGRFSYDYQEEQQLNEFKALVDLHMAKNKIN